MSHLPRDIVTAIKHLLDLAEKHDLDSLKMDISLRTGAGQPPVVSVAINVLGHYWKGLSGEDDEDVIHLDDDWEKRVVDDLTREIKRSAATFADLAKQRHADRRESEQAAKKLEENAERARRLAPDVVTELGIIGETAEDISEPTLDDLEFAE